MAAKSSVTVHFCRQKIRPSGRTFVRKAEQNVSTPATISGMEVSIVRRGSSGRSFVANGHKRQLNCNNSVELEVIVMRSVICACETWRPNNLARDQYAVIMPTGLTHLLNCVITNSVDAVLLEGKIWDVSSKTLSRWIKAIRPEIPVVLLSDRALFPDQIPPHVDAVLTKGVDGKMLNGTLEALPRA